MAFPKSGFGLVGIVSGKADGGIVHTSTEGCVASNAYIANALDTTSTNCFIHTMKGGTAKNCVVMYATEGARLDNCHIYDLGEGCEATGIMGSCVTVKGRLVQVFGGAGVSEAEIKAWNDTMSDRWKKLVAVGCTPLTELFGWCKDHLSV
jgi:hypothetical protein